MPEAPVSPTPPKRDWKGPALLATLVCLIGTALWFQRTATAEAGRGSARTDHIEAVVLGILFTVVSASAFMLWRLSRQVRIEMTRRNQLIHELRGSEAKYRSIFDNAIEGIFQTTPEEIGRAHV